MESRLTVLIFIDWWYVVSHREIVDNHEKENALNIVTEEQDLPDLCRISWGCKVHLKCIFILFQCALFNVCNFHIHLLRPHVVYYNLFHIVGLYLSCLCCSGWFNVLSRVHSATPEQLLQMQHEHANPKNAVVSVHTKLTH